ncbi:MAG: hypothetical protein B6A08_07055 [Sorangiineae bacterium NIC37A_2]|jgi:uncharacterized protein YqgC (DUF456 family)|nr:MAG: hypothetical protein B6A08_07055 [Sorangiineae bacterium NIC37A_2]
MTGADIFLTVLGVLLVLAGLVGTLLPILPSTPFVFLGLWLIAWVDDYAHVGPLVLWILAGLTVLTLVLDFVAGILGAERVAASRAALVGAALGSVVGIFGGFLGVILGPLLGAALGELYARSDMIRAGKVALATWIGMLLGALAKVAIAIVMVGIFLVAWIF